MSWQANDWALGMTAAELDDFTDWWIADALATLADEPTSRDCALLDGQAPSGPAARLRRHESDEAGLAPGSA